MMAGDGTRVPKSEELALVASGAASGVAWGLLALVLGLSVHPTHVAGALRVSIIILGLPFYLAGWLGSILQPPFVDPTAMVITIGATLGVLPAAALMSVQRLRNEY
jgi:hypothetical protein